MSDWRMAKSLDVLLDELNELYPRRSKKSDGGIGNAEHQSRHSDHNAWAPPPRGGVVTARDFTHDPKSGLNCSVLANHLRSRALHGDRRVKYIIWDHRITSVTSGWAWRSYSGSNPHTHHLHLSVAPIASLFDDDSSWGLVGQGTKPLKSPAAEKWGTFSKAMAGSRTLYQWHTGKDVALLQRFLGLPDDGYFGSKTKEAVKDYQKMRGLTADGVVGPKTWGPIVKALGI